ncbi:MAG TPA: hypothetical protein PK247_03900 [Candidatus Goldiibacteriota bacterium]|nr:hypothetical protein [Candidatus Goldiibacteriota bacterium]
MENKNEIQAENSAVLTEEEEALLREFEEERREKSPAPEPQKEEPARQNSGSSKATEADVTELRRLIEEEMRAKIENELRSKIELELRVDMADRIRAEIEPDIRKQVEAEMRVKYEDIMKDVEKVEADVALREKEMRKKIEAELEARIRRDLEFERNKKQEEIIKKLEMIEGIEAKNARLQEEEIKKSLKEEMKKEIEEEREKKKADLLKKLETAQKSTMAEQLQKEKVRTDTRKQGAVIIAHSEKLVLLRLFEETQKVLMELMTAYMAAKKVEAIFVRSLEKAAKKNPDVLKKASVDKDGKIRNDGSVEVARILSNVNALSGGEEKKTLMFFKALQDIFDERIIEAETGTDLETKDKIMSALLAKVDRVFAKSEFNRKMGNYFMEYIVPNTSMTSGENI